MVALTTAASGFAFTNVFCVAVSFKRSKSRSLAETVAEFGSMSTVNLKKVDLEAQRMQGIVISATGSV